MPQSDASHRLRALRLAGVLEVRALSSPTPAAGEVVVSVRAAALNPKDSLIRKGKFRGVTGGRFPRQLGYDVSCVGDEVFGMKNGWAGGTVAEEVCLLEGELALN